LIDAAPPVMVRPAEPVKSDEKVFAPANVCVVVETSPGFVPSARESVRTFEVIEPPFALVPVGVPSEVTIEEPEASFESAMFAEALMSAFTISPSVISADSILLPKSVKVPDASGKVYVRTPVKSAAVMVPVFDAAPPAVTESAILSSVPVAVCTVAVPVEVNPAPAVRSDEKVFAPASVCVPVVMRPRADAPASGMFKVREPPSDAGEPLTFTSVPDVPVVRPIVEFAKSAFATVPFTMSLP
jgi:hypothetical protein